MALGLNALLTQICRDKGIDKALLVEAVESALLSAARKHFGHNLNLETRFDPETDELEVVEYKTVVSVVEDPATQVSIQEARHDYDDPEAMVGDEMGRKLSTEELGRIAAQTAKQVIIQRVRDAERGAIYDEYKNLKGDLVNGIVQRYDRGNLIVNLGRTEAMLPKREQIGKERYRQGDRIRSMILDIDRSSRGPQIILTRSHPDFLRKLFETEVPEIADRTIEIKSVSREPGERAKIAVSSSDAGIDPVGACVGIKGARVQSVVQELKGERIDIVTWTPDDPSFVARALAPAEVVRVVVDEDKHSMEVIVNDDQLSLAIGRRGQNVKLASRLTGWRLDVRSVSVAEEDARRCRRSIEAIPGLSFTEVEQLFQDGFRSAQEIANADSSDLLQIDGFTPERVNEILESARNYVDSAKDLAQNLEVLGDLDRLAIDEVLRDMLKSGGYHTIQSVVEADSEELLRVPGIDEDELTLIREATDSFLRGSQVVKMKNFRL